MAAKFETREAWLMRGVELIDGLFAEIEKKVPKNLRVSCGFPSKSALAAGKRRIGECWSSTNSRDKKFEIFISPTLDDPCRVLDVLTHELVHACVGLKCGHRGEFKRVAVELGLTGPMTATVCGDDLRKRLNNFGKMLGAYPHGKLDKMTNGQKKQGTRLLKVECPGCGCVARMTAKWLEKGFPTCACGEVMACKDFFSDDEDDGGE